MTIQSGWYPPPYALVNFGHAKFGACALIFRTVTSRLQREAPGPAHSLHGTRARAGAGAACWLGARAGAAPGSTLQAAARGWRRCPGARSQPKARGGHGRARKRSGGVSCGLCAASAPIRVRLGVRRNENDAYATNPRDGGSKLTQMQLPGAPQPGDVDGNYCNAWICGRISEVEARIGTASCGPRLHMRQFASGSSPIRCICVSLLPVGGVGATCWLETRAGAAQGSTLQAAARGWRRCPTTRFQPKAIGGERAGATGDARARGRRGGGDLRAAGQAAA